MFNVRSIISNNNATFYDYNSRKKRSQKPRAIATCSLAIIAALIFPNISNDLLAGFLTVQSILLGFTFNVMFFLLGNREKRTLNASSIEIKIRTSRLRDLYRELFYNVSYFNLIALASIVVALLLLLPAPEIPDYLHKFLLVQKCTYWMDTPKFATARGVLRSSAVFLFYTVSIEVIFSITRLIGRTSFYFERKVDEAERFDQRNQG